MALGSTQPLTEINTGIIPRWGWEAIKVAGAKARETYHLHVRTVMKFGSLSLLESSEPVQTCTGIVLSLTI
jgi:hypothetical protein